MGEGKGMGSPTFSTKNQRVWLSRGLPCYHVAGAKKFSVILVRVTLVRQGSTGDTWFGWKTAPFAARFHPLFGGRT